MTGAHDRERRHGEQQEQEDVAPGGARRLSEEQRAGERRGDARVGTDARRVRGNEP